MHRKVTDGRACGRVKEEEGREKENTKKHERKSVRDGEGGREWRKGLDLHE